MPKSAIMNIETLIKAAEYIERKDREAEHGYATTRPAHAYYQSRRKVAVNKRMKSRGIARSSHNELEKNRRAHLRGCLERLKDVVPLGRDASRHTTLGLLKAAKTFIKRLEETDSQQQSYKEQLMRNHQYLQQTLSQLSSSHYRVHSVSECSTVSSALSTAESISSVDSEEVDIIGFSSSGFQSDVDDQNSIDSISSDSGILLLRKSHRL